MSLRNPHALKIDTNLKDTSDQIKIWVREALSLSGGAIVTVSEINCRDPGCPGVETAILVMTPQHPTRMIRIASPMVQIQRADITIAAE